MRVPKLSRVFRIIRMIDEATLDVDKFRRHIPKAAPIGSAYTTQADIMKQMAAEDEPRATKKGSMFKTVVPQPMSHIHDVASIDPKEAQELGLKRLSSSLASPDHWERGRQGQYGAIRWLDADWLQPKSREAKRLVDIIERNKIDTKDVYSRKTWKRFFAKEFGEM